MNTSEIHTLDRLQLLESRLVDLERQLTAGKNMLRWHRRALLGGFLLVFGMTAVAATSMAPPADVIHARRLEILNADGKLVFAASGGEAGGQIDLWSSAGRNVLRAGVNAHGGDLAIWNNDQHSVFGAFASTAGAEVDLWNATGGRTARIWADARGGKLSVHDGSDRTAAIIAAGDKGGEVNLH